MGKLIPVIFVVLVAAVAGLPPVFGLVYERQFEEQIRIGQPNPYMEVRVADYERGLYESHATIAFSLSDQYVEQMEAALLSPGSEQPANPERLANAEEFIEFLNGELQFDVDIEHGPWAFPNGEFIGLANVDSELDSSTGALSELQKKLGLPHLFAVTAQVGLDGSTDFQADVPPFTYGETGAEVDFSGLFIDGQFNNDDGRVVSTGRIDSLSLNGLDRTLAIADIGFNTDASFYDNYLWVGSSGFGVREIALTDADIGDASVTIRDSGVKATVNVNESGEKIAMDIGYFVGDISGIPEMTLSDLRLNFGLSDINLEAMYAYADLTRNMGFISEDNAAEFMEQAESVVFQVLSNSPSVSIDPMTFNMNGEPFAAQLQVTFDGTALPAGSTLISLVANPVIWMSGLSGNGRIETSEVMANQIAGSIVKNRITASLDPETEVSEADLASMASDQSRILIDGFVQQGMIRRTEGVLSSEFSYNEGELIVNDTLLPLGMF